MEKKDLTALIIACVVVIGSTFLGKPKSGNESNPTNQPKQEMYLGQTAEQNDNSKLCGWIDKSDIIIKVNLAPGVKKDTSYETGFMFGPNYFPARVAREGCGYRVGFNYSEMKGKGISQVGVRGYSDNKMRTIVGAPINVNFDKDGKPDVGNRIEVTITD